ncbi:rhamnose ABC transporter substrate-binding protein [Streptomonospora nanhaiensis]|uniref:rhamnose ABC transporter substrate-binding protein n=1 Tax=Streptomonospora nanhaiensis TaxID=1323731 RepID=UPI001C3848D6|nr:rhamnose ABC transporter substrate-binding protein [Streptomonospora nanhaiensis]MBV2364707.1 rhamnose ABC transporter substrate-binding protein [Streptomonospora nanhaiensis]MBX9388314.1 rhamnose ABC transporter substrate-binding protein [Streptomonospora nanhaiensis]
MMRKRIRYGVTAAALAGVMLAATACGGTTRGDDSGDGSGGGAQGEADPNAEIPEGLAISFLPKQLNNPYMTYANSGGQEAVEELAGEFKEVGPSEANASSQVSYINTLSQQGSDAIVIAANDPDAVCGALNQARQAGSVVVSYDSDTNPDCRDVFINQATAEDIARIQVEMVAEQIGGEGEIAFLSATPNATNQNTWLELMEEELAKEEYADIEVVDTVYGNDDDQKSFNEMQALLQSHPDLAGVVAPTTVGLAAAARYLSGSDFKGEVVLTGLGTPNQMQEYVEDGTVEEFALWDPKDMGYLAGYAAASLSAGRITGAEGETFEAGRLGDYEIGANGEVVLGPPTVFNADNIDDYDF